jgi:glycosyltransferase involved in cell wall biosynthesis
MKLSIVTQSTYPFEIGGAQLHTYHLATALQKDGHAVSIITTGNKATEQIIEGIKYVRVKKPSKPLLNSLLIFSRFYRQLTKEKPDFILIDLLTTGLSELPVSLFSFLKKTPYIVTAHGIELKNSNLYSYHFIRIILTHATKVISVSNELRSFITVKYSIPNEKILVVPTAYSPLEIQKAKVKTCYVYDNKLKVVFVGRLASEKDPFTLLKAAKTIVNMGINLQLNIVGDGELMSDLQAFCDANNLGTYVNFVGAVEHSKALEWMYQSDMIVLSSLGEGLPTVLIEAMALGKPAVSTNVGAVKELIKNKQNGFLVAPKNAKELVEAVVEVKKDKKFYDFLSTNAEKSVSELTWSRVSKKYIRVLIDSYQER